MGLLRGVGGRCLALVLVGDWREGGGGWDIHTGEGIVGGSCEWHCLFVWWEVWGAEGDGV